MTRSLFRRLTLLGLALLIGSAWADELIGRVVGIADGDTLTVLTAQRQQHRGRLCGIDASEKREAFGQVSKQRLSDLAYGNTVQVVFHKPARYPRLLGKVHVNGADVDLNPIQPSMPWHDKRYEREQSPADPGGLRSRRKESPRGAAWPLGRMGRPSPRLHATRASHPAHASLGIVSAGHRPVCNTLLLR